ncbi:MAG TPA: D-glycero-beta-D-manno-heptose 1-phosphate adenylyltransferase [Planctomycetes bacterium]|nr:D-glycero-beta-D-manno-heptose 1-phosphate adenylyltransferase [Planctomycetota bacterium]HIL36214.1 D-glycero-beta-D-manno-heptose 1-phosphate adenylyltransferase [Planctomycetota bacterium]
MSALIRLDPNAAQEHLTQLPGATTIGLAVGCFDLLHVGHIRMLVAAREFVDCIVVALNTDASVRGLKGPNRPLVMLNDRAELLSALHCVDLITSFDEPTAESLIDLLQPAALIKGTDRTLETVPEASQMKAIGGQVLFLGGPKTHSSTELASRAETGKATS